MAGRWPEIGPPSTLSSSHCLAAELADTEAQRHREIEAMLKTGIILDPRSCKIIRVLQVGTHSPADQTKLMFSGLDGQHIAHAV